MPAAIMRGSGHAISRSRQIMRGWEPRLRVEVFVGTGLDPVRLLVRTATRSVDSNEAVPTVERVGRASLPAYLLRGWKPRLRVEVFVGTGLGPVRLLIRTATRSVDSNEAVPTVERVGRASLPAYLLRGWKPRLQARDNFTV